MKVKDLINLIFGLKDFMLVDAWNGKVLYRSWSSSKKKLDEFVDLEVLGFIMYPEFVVPGDIPIFAVPDDIHTEEGEE